MLRPLFYERLQNQPSKLQSPNQFLIGRDQSARLRLLEATRVAQAFATVAPARSALRITKPKRKAIYLAVHRFGNALYYTKRG